jgi:PAS domain S-box-containing protein
MSKGQNKEESTEIEKLHLRIAELEKNRLEFSVLKEKLLESELNYNTLYENSPLAFQSLDTNGIINNVNPAWLSTMGYQKEEVIGKKFTHFLHPDFYEIFEKRFKKFKETGNIQQLPFTLRHKNGNNIDVTYNGRAIYTKENKFLNTHCFFQDITLQRKAEISLKNSEIKLSSIIEHSQQGIFLLNRKLEITFFNKAFLSIIGYPKKEVLNMNFQYFLAEKSKKRLTKNHNKRLSGNKETISYELNCIQKNGTIRRVEITSSPYNDYDNQINTLAQLVDITETYDILTKLKQTKDDYLNLFQDVNDAIFVLYPEDEIILDCNKKALKMYGFSKEEMIGKSLKSLSKDPEKGESKIQEVLEKGEISNFETTQYNRSGVEIRMEVSAKTIQYQNGIAILSINHDITQRKKQERTLKFLVEISKISYHEISLNNYLGKIHQELKKLMKADNLYIALYDKGTGQYQLPYHIDEYDKVDVNQTLDLSQSLTHYTLKSGKAQLINKSLEEELRSKKELNRSGTSSAIWLGAPLFDSQNDEAIGVIVIQDYQDPIAYSTEDLHTLEFIANHIGLFIDRVKNIEELRITRNTAEVGKRRYKSLFKENHSVMIIIDMETRNIVDANQSACTFYGYTLEEITKLNIKQINTLPEAQIKIEMENAKNRKKKHFYFNHRLANGVIKPVQVYSGIINHDNQEFLYSIVHDISKRIEFEKALKKSEEKFRMLFENAPLGIYIALPNGQIIDCNTALLSMIGSPSVEATLQINIKTFSPLIKNGFSKVFQECINTGNEQSIDLLYTSRWDKTAWLSAYIFPLKNNNNEVSSVFTIMEDITSRKKAEQEIIKAKERAEESDRLKSAFLANMSHEIRTPMNGILGFTDLLKDPDLSDKVQQQYIDIIQSSGDRMLDTVNDIIEISKIETGQVNVSISILNVNEQIEYYYNFFKYEAEKKGLSINFKNPLNTAKSQIKTDHAKFDSILNNLIKNAIKYTKEGNIEIGYELINKNQEKILQFYVKDTGIGVPKDRQEAIFNRFIQADVEDKRASQGVGLGLAITKAYVEMLRGQIWLDSIENIGSTFYFTLPYIIPEIEKRSNNSREKATSTSITRKLKILIAEDNPAAYKYLSILLDNGINEIIHVSNGNDAVEKCREDKNLDLVLMDIQMPNMNGHKATREIRKFNKELIIIAQTAYALEGDRKKALEAGCNDYITKPIKKKELMEIINNWLK